MVVVMVVFDIKNQGQPRGIVLISNVFVLRLYEIPWRSLSTPQHPHVCGTNIFIINKWKACLMGVCVCVFVCVCVCV